MGSLYIGAQGCVPVLLENLHGMSCSGTCWPLGGAWFQCKYGGAFVLGLAYGYTFIKTKTAVYPMIMHSMSNVISVGGCYLYMHFVK